MKNTSTAPLLLTEQQSDAPVVAPEAPVSPTTGKLRRLAAVVGITASALVYPAYATEPTQVAAVAQTGAAPQKVAFTRSDGKVIMVTPEQLARFQAGMARMDAERAESQQRIAVGEQRIAAAQQKGAAADERIAAAQQKGAAADACAAVDPDIKHFIDEFRAVQISGDYSPLFAIEDRTRAALEVLDTACRSSGSITPEQYTITKNSIEGAYQFARRQQQVAMKWGPSNDLTLPNQKQSTGLASNGSVTLADPDKQP